MRVKNTFTAIKKPMDVKVIEFYGHEIVETLEGNSYRVFGKTHYILEGPAGERWPIDKKIFKKTYERKGKTNE